MSRKDILDFQSYLANKHTLPDGVPDSIHQEIFGVVEGYTSAQEEVYEDLVKMVWRVVTAIETRNQAFFPDTDEIPTVEQIEKEYQDSIREDVELLIEFTKKYMKACVKNAGRISLNVSALEPTSESRFLDAARLRSAIAAANTKLNTKGWCITLLDHKINIYTQKAKQKADETNWQNAR